MMRRGDCRLQIKALNSWLLLAAVFCADGAGRLPVPLGSIVLQALEELFIGTGHRELHYTDDPQRRHSYGSWVKHRNARCRTAIHATV